MWMMRLVRAREGQGDLTPRADRPFARSADRKLTRARAVFAHRPCVCGLFGSREARDCCLGSTNCNENVRESMGAAASRLNNI